MVTVSVATWLVPPTPDEAAVTVTLLVPAGVMGVVVPPDVLAPPQPVMNAPAPIDPVMSTVPSTIARLKWEALRRNSQSNRPVPMPHGRKIPARNVEEPPWGFARDAVLTFVAIVSVEVRGAPAGVNVPGEKEQVELAGSPVQVNCTDCANPLLGVNVKTAVPDCPPAIVRAAGLAVTVKSGSGTMVSVYAWLPV